MSDVLALPDSIQFDTANDAPLLKVWLPDVNASVAPVPCTLPVKAEVPFRVSVSPEAIVSDVPAAPANDPPVVRFSLRDTVSLPVSDQCAVASVAPLLIA